MLDIVRPNRQFVQRILIGIKLYEDRVQPEFLSEQAWSIADSC